MCAHVVAATSSVTWMWSVSLYLNCCSWWQYSDISVLSSLWSGAFQLIFRTFTSVISTAALQTCWLVSSKWLFTTALSYRWCKLIASQIVWFSRVLLCYPAAESDLFCGVLSSHPTSLQLVVFSETAELYPSILKPFCKVRWVILWYDNYWWFKWPWKSLYSCLVLRRCTIYTPCMDFFLCLVAPSGSYYY